MPDRKTTHLPLATFIVAETEGEKEEKKRKTFPTGGHRLALSSILHRDLLRLSIRFWNRLITPSRYAWCFSFSPC